MKTTCELLFSSDTCYVLRGLIFPIKKINVSLKNRYMPQWNQWNLFLVRQNSLHLTERMLTKPLSRQGCFAKRCSNSEEKLKNSRRRQKTVPLWNVTKILIAGVRHAVTILTSALGTRGLLDTATMQAVAEVFLFQASIFFFLFHCS